MALKKEKPVGIILEVSFKVFKTSGPNPYSAIFKKYRVLF
jgi:hypothetical protein|tara:strand:- start:1466 stop:1585 length:120 start_codon:yes stop_codon:yes gene_type:complete